MEFEDLEEFNLAEEVLQKMREDPDFLRRELAEGKSYQEIFKYSDEVMATFYKAAHGLFETQSYKEAADAFFFLTNLNPYHHAYWLGLGMSEHLNEDHSSALIAYGMAAMTDQENPLPHYHSASCYRELLDIENAIASYDLAIQIADGHEHHSALKSHAHSAKQALLRRR